MKNEIKVILTADIKALQSALAKAQKSLQDFEAKNAAETEKSNESKKRQLGIIEKLNKEAEKLKLSLTRATNKEDIAKFNQQLEQTKKKLSDLNALGKSSSNPVGLINNLNAEAKKLKNAIALATDEKTVARLNAELKRTQQELIRINSLGKSIAAPAVKSFDNLKRSAGAASGAAISFGRIIQDAPFGIIGVANNIQNFSEQFSALGGKATSAGGKLKLFFSALITPANLAILAVSALTAAYQAYSLGLFDADEETKDLRTESEKLNDSLDLITKNLNAVDSARLKANKSAADELSELQLLNSVLTNTGKSEKERILVYDKLLEKYPKIIGNISKEKAITEGLGEAYNLLISSIRERASLEAISGAFTDVEKERIDLIVKERKETLLQNQLIGRKSELLKNIASLSKSSNNLTARGTTIENGFSQALSRNQAELALVNEQLSLLGNVTAKATEKALQENSGTLTILQEQYGGLNQALANLSEGEPDKTIKRTSENLSLLNDSLTILGKQKENFFAEDTAEFFRSFDPQAIVGPVQGASMIYTENVEAMIQKNKEFEEALNSIGLTSAQVFQAIANGAAEGYGSFNEFITDLATTQQFFNEAFAVLEAGIENTIGDVAFSIGEALGSGGDALRSGGGALLGGMAAILNQLGQLAIQAGITIEATKQSLKTLNGPIAIAAGVAMIALAGYLSSQSKSLAGKFGGGSMSAGTGSTYTNKREFGGPVSKGRAYIVGERRPELFVPNTNGVIIPQLPSMDYSGASMSAGAMAVDVNIRGVSYGDDILFTVQQAQIRRGIR
jgi:hypothetical protein